MGYDESNHTDKQSMHGLWAVEVQHSSPRGPRGHVYYNFFLCATLGTSWGLGGDSGGTRLTVFFGSLCIGGPFFKLTSGRCVDLDINKKLCTREPHGKEQEGPVTQ